MMRNSLNIAFKFCLVVALGAITSIAGCANAESIRSNDLPIKAVSAPKVIGINQSIEDLRNYFKTLKLFDVDSLQGKTPEARLKSQEWLFQNYAEGLAIRGVNKEKLLQVAYNDAGVTKLVNRYFQGQGQFADYLNLAEIAVIARVGDPVPNNIMTFAGPAFFNLDISDNLLNTPSFDKITVINSFSSHSRTLEAGKICVFFLSPTRTKYLNLLGENFYSILDYLFSNAPNNFLMDGFPTYCSKDGETFSSNSQIGGLDVIKKFEILNLAKSIH